FVLCYFLVVNSAYLGLVALASVEVVKHRRRVPFAGSNEAYRSPLTDPVTIIMPAYNEGSGIVSAVQAVAALRYPTYEAVVVVGVANGCRGPAGRVVDVRMPRGWLARIQVVEYLRAFLLGRTGWSRLGGVLIISGAFGLFRRDVLVDVGGLAEDCIGEDAELVVRLHRYARQSRRAYRVVFVAEPVSWSEAPSTMRVLARQRRRWHRGITEILHRHRGMVGNPRYGRIGLLALPYYFAVELLAPLVELSALVLVPVGLLVGAVDLDFV